MPAIVLAVALLLTAAATIAAGLFARGRDRARFESGARAVTGAISARLDAYLAMLLGTAGLFASSDAVDPDEFRSYVAKLDLARHYPGARGIGMARRVPADSLAAVVAESRRIVASDFAVWPEDPPREEYGPILLLEPLDAVNRRALGFDMFSQPNRREAMVRARETGDAALSGPVRLVQNDVVGDTLPGFLIYLPLYRNGAAVGDEASRRRHHVVPVRPGALEQARVRRAPGAPGDHLHLGEPRCGRGRPAGGGGGRGRARRSAGGSGPQHRPRGGRPPRQQATGRSRRAPLAAP